MKTKEKIIEYSRSLFNDYGVENVSLRKISEELKISLGNLTYHFKKRDDIVEFLYFQYVEQFEEKTSLALLSSANSEATFLQNWLEKIYEINLEYRFVLNDILHLTRNYKKIRTAHKKFIQTRSQEWKQMIQRLSEAGLVRKLDLVSMEMFLLQAFITEESFFSKIKLSFGIPKKQWFPVFFHLFFSLFSIHLTPKGQSEFKKMLENHIFPSFKLFESSQTV